MRLWRICTRSQVSRIANGNWNRTTPNMLTAIERACSPVVCCIYAQQQQIQRTVCTAGDNWAEIAAQMPGRNDVCVKARWAQLHKARSSSCTSEDAEASQEGQDLAAAANPPPAAAPPTPGTGALHPAAAAAAAFARSGPSAAALIAARMPRMVAVQGPGGGVVHLPLFPSTPGAPPGGLPAGVTPPPNTVPVQTPHGVLLVPTAMADIMKAAMGSAASSAQAQAQAVAGRPPAGTPLALPIAALPTAEGLASAPVGTPSAPAPSVKLPVHSAPAPDSVASTRVGTLASVSAAHAPTAPAPLVVLQGSIHPQALPSGNANSALQQQLLQGMPPGSIPLMTRQVLTRGPDGQPMQVSIPVLPNGQPLPMQLLQHTMRGPSGMLFLRPNAMALAGGGLHSGGMAASMPGSNRPSQAASISAAVAAARAARMGGAASASASAHTAPRRPGGDEDDALEASVDTISDMHTGRKRPNLESSLDMSWGGVEGGGTLQWPSPPRPGGDDHSYELDDSTDDFRLGAGGLGSTAPAALFGSASGSGRSGQGSPESPHSPRAARPKSSSDTHTQGTSGGLRIRAGGVMGHNIESVSHLTPRLDEGINWASSGPSTPQGPGVPAHPHARGRSDSALSDVSRTSRKRDAHDVTRRSSGSAGHPSSPFGGPVAAPSEPRVLAHRRSSNASVASGSSQGAAERHQDTMASTWGSLTSQGAAATFTSDASGQRTRRSSESDSDSDQDLAEAEKQATPQGSQEVIWEFNLAGTQAARPATAPASRIPFAGTGGVRGSVPQERSAPVVAGVTPRSRRTSDSSAPATTGREGGAFSLGARLPAGSPAPPAAAAAGSLFSPGGVSTPATYKSGTRDAFAPSSSSHTPGGVRSNAPGLSTPHTSRHAFLSPGATVDTPDSAGPGSLPRALPERTVSDVGGTFGRAVTDEVELDLSTSLTALSLDGSSGGGGGEPGLSVVGTSMRIYHDGIARSGGMAPPGQTTAAGAVGALWGSGEVIDGLIVTDDGTDVIHDLNVPDASELNTSNGDMGIRTGSPYGTLGIGALSGAPSTFQASPSHGRRDERISLLAATGGAEPPLPSFHSLSGDIAFALSGEGATEAQLASAAATLAAAAAAARSGDGRLDGSTSLDVSL